MLLSSPSSPKQLHFAIWGQVSFARKIFDPDCLVFISHPSECLSTGQFLSVISIISLVLYFVTSSDSGSLVIDCLSANGHPDPPVVQRIFWALTEGACATGLLVAGGSEALLALQVLIFTIPDGKQSDQQFYTLPQKLRTRPLSNVLLRSVFSFCEKIVS